MVGRAAGLRLSFALSLSICTFGPRSGFVGGWGKSRRSVSRVGGKPFPRSDIVVLLLLLEEKGGGLVGSL